MGDDRMAQTKATKKFEKHHLKDTLERRKGLKKVKQKQQLKAKNKARRAEENGRDVDTREDGNTGAKNGVKRSAKDAFQDMSVDDFFQGGFEVPDLPAMKRDGRKRKRLQEESDDEASEASFDQEPVPLDLSASEGESDEDDDAEDHKQQLDALAKNDPEFYKHLQDNEPELLDAQLAEIGELSDDDKEEPERRKVKKGQDVADESDADLNLASKNELTKATLEKWQTALTTQHSLRAAREVVMAFRSAAHVSDADDEDGKAFKYRISDPDAYHRLLAISLTHIPEIFQHHLPVQESKHGKVRVETSGKKFKTLTPLLRSQISSILRLLDHLSDASTLRLTLKATAPLLPYLLSFKKLVRDLIKAITTVWSASSNTDATRIEAFLLLRRIAVIADAGIRESLLKHTYQALVKASRHTTVHTIAGVNLMKNSAAELWGLIDNSVAYTTAFTFVRQLAIHLRQSIQDNKNEGYKTVYNWQYVHSLDFWSRVLSVHCVTPDAPLRPLIYPLVQVTLGALRLIPTATYFPLRFQLIRSLLRLSRTTGTYIPLAAPLYEVLNSAEMRRSPKASTLKPLDFATAIRAPKAYLKTRIYQDGLGELVQELLAEFFVLWCKNTAFPELSLPVTVILKRWLKDVNNRTPGKGNKNAKVNGMISLLVQKLEANSAFVAERRGKVQFAPNDRKGVEAFLEDIGWEKLPVGAFVVGQRKGREERATILEEARREEDERRKRREARRDVGADMYGGADAEEEEGVERSDEEDAGDGMGDGGDEEIEDEDVDEDGEEGSDLVFEEFDD